MYHPSFKTKGADQLCSYTADLCLCFGIGKNSVFSFSHDANS